MKKTSLLLTLFLLLGCGESDISFVSADDIKDQKTTALENSITQSAILGENRSALEVNKNLVFDLNISNTTLSWQSSDVASISESGVVTQYACLESDKNVTLTATIGKDGYSTTKSFEVSVVTLPLKVVNEVLDTTLLDASDTLTTVTHDLTLPEISCGEVKWSSTNGELLNATTGKVTQPVGFDDVTVKLILDFTLYDQNVIKQLAYTIVRKNALTSSEINSVIKGSTFKSDTCTFTFNSSVQNFVQNCGDVNSTFVISTRSDGTIDVGENNETGIILNESNSSLRLLRVKGTALGVSTSKFLDITKVEQ